MARLRFRRHRGHGATVGDDSETDADLILVAHGTVGHRTLLEVPLDTRGSER